MSADDNVGRLFGQMQEMQGKMAELQRNLATRTFEGSSGGGMVTAVATGELRIREIHIEPGLFDSQDRSMIQDLTSAAVNAALGNAQQGVQAEFQRLTGGVQIPGFGPGGSQ
jgi:DNA-binding YbaB/EbfC family protein